MSLKWILDAANKRYTDLPRMERYVEGGRNQLCYTWMFRHCPWGHQCEFQHPPAREFTDEFVTQCHKVFKPRLEYIFRTKPAAP